MSPNDGDQWEYETLRPPRGETKKESEDPKAEVNELAAEGWRFIETIVGFVTQNYIHVFAPTGTTEIHSCPHCEGQRQRQKRTIVHNDPLPDDRKDRSHHSQIQVMTTGRRVCMGSEANRPATKPSQSPSVASVAYQLSRGTETRVEINHQALRAIPNRITRAPLSSSLKRGSFPNRAAIRSLCGRFRYFVLQGTRARSWPLELREMGLKCAVCNLRRTGRF